MHLSLSSSPTSANLLLHLHQPPHRPVRFRPPSSLPSIQSTPSPTFPSPSSCTKTSFQTPELPPALPSRTNLQFIASLPPPPPSLYLPNHEVTLPLSSFKELRLSTWITHASKWLNVLCTSILVYVCMCVRERERE